MKNDTGINIALIVAAVALILLNLHWLPIGLAYYIFGCCSAALTIYTFQWTEEADKQERDDVA